jgi:hypothetical protein
MHIYGFVERALAQSSAGSFFELQKNELKGLKSLSRVQIRIPREPVDRPGAGLALPGPLALPALLPICARPLQGEQDSRVRPSLKSLYGAAGMKEPRKSPPSKPQPTPEEKLDEELEESFPASDPPSNTPTSAGGPARSQTRHPKSDKPPRRD